MIISQMIALKLLAGASAIVAPVPDTHTLNFSSVSRSASFSAVQRQTTFNSVSRQIVMTDTPDPLGFILTEDGDIIAQENDVPIAQE